MNENEVTGIIPHPFTIPLCKEMGIREDYDKLTNLLYKTTLVNCLLWTALI